jgi:hypothetical protein
VIDLIELSGGELYGLPEARGFLARTVIGSRLGSAAVTVGRLGGELYREGTVGIALATPAHGTIALEVGGRLLILGARGMPDRIAAAVDAGLVTRALGRIAVCGRWRNVGESRIGGSPISSGGAVGAVLALEEVRLAGSVELEPGLGARAAFGCEASLHEWLRVRTGVALDPATFGVGVGIGRDPDHSRATRGAGPTRPTIDLAVTWHPDLGGSSFATISLRR